MAYTLHTAVRTIMSDARARAVLDKHVPGASTHPRLPEAMDMTIRELSEYPESGLTPDILKAIAADMEQL
jgi:hypothetical protein